MEFGCTYDHIYNGYCNTNDPFSAGVDNCGFFGAVSPGTGNGYFDKENCQNPNGLKDTNVLFQYFGTDSRCFRSKWVSYLGSALMSNCLKFKVQINHNWNI